MSFVGPRPELAMYVEQFRSDYEELLRTRPGLADPASLEFRNEEELLRGQPEAESYYLRDILPRKIQLSREYLHKRTFFSDLQLIIKTITLTLRTPLR
jgi:lipopolysaccharide/colanic/teichoic acid biosynthesis glycosyltransferase